MQWDGTVNAGFSFGQDVKPWLPVNENYGELNVDAKLQDENSILNFYRQLLRVRRNSEALRRGSWKSLIKYPDEHLIFVRETEHEKVLVMINFAYEKPMQIDRPIEPGNWIVLASTWLDAGQTITLPDTLHPFEISILKQG